MWQHIFCTLFSDITWQLINTDPGRNLNVMLGGGISSFLPEHPSEEESKRYPYQNVCVTEDQTRGLKLSPMRGTHWNEKKSLRVTYGEKKWATIRDKKSLRPLM
jgi:hypothetical protein